jgi:hypothetical protein
LVCWDPAFWLVCAATHLRVWKLCGEAHVTVAVSQGFPVVLRASIGSRREARPDRS